MNFDVTQFIELIISKTPKEADEWLDAQYDLIIINIQDQRLLIV